MVYKVLIIIYFKSLNKFIDYINNQRDLIRIVRVKTIYKLVYNCNKSLKKHVYKCKYIIVYICNLIRNMHLENYNTIKEINLSGRYITLNTILPLIKKLNFKTSLIGKSFLNKDIYKVELGTGKIKILIWSQMHGNESTGTKALFDLFNFFESPLKDSQTRDRILNNCTITIVPMLNPDGALVYSRLNAQNIDLNRDAVDLKAPESRVLKKLLDTIKPDYCFNLHDQRPIFSVGKANLPATISFLAPSEDVERTVTQGRIETMKVIVAMNKVISKLIPNQIGRYTDEFYPKATGDNFQKAGFNTILIEAGHFNNDYNREQVRMYNFIALLSGIEYVSNKIEVDYIDYFKIPNNEKKYYEFLFENVELKGEKVKIGVFLEDSLKNNNVVFTKNYIVLTINDKSNSKHVVSKKLIFSNKDKIVFYLNTDLKNN